MSNLKHYKYPLFSYYNISITSRKLYAKLILVQNKTFSPGNKFKKRFKQNILHSIFVGHLKNDRLYV